jgi:hypothetical protein
VVDSAHAGRAAAGRSAARVLGRRFAAAFAAWSAVLADRVVIDRLIARHCQRADRRRCSVALLGWAEAGAYTRARQTRLEQPPGYIRGFSWVTRWTEELKTLVHFSSQPEPNFTDYSRRIPSLQKRLC